MELITERKKGIPVVMKWIKDNVPQTGTAMFTREEIRESIHVTDGILSRVILVLKIKGYLSYKQNRLTPGEYQLLKDISPLTTEQIDQWVREYGQEKVRQQKARIGESGIEQPASSIFEPTPARPALVPQYRSETETPAETPYIGTLKRSEPSFFTPLRSAIQVPTVTPGIALTPAQQRLKEIQQQLEEAQKAAEDEAKQLAETPSAAGTNDEILTMFDNRIESIEGKVNIMLTFFEQATVALRGLSTIDSPKAEEVAPAEPTTRTLLVRLVNSFAAAERRTEHETWKFLYGQFDIRMGFNAYVEAPNKTRDQSYLTVIEKRGQIEPLYDLARKLLVLPALK